MPLPRLAYPMEEAAEVLGIGRTTIYALVRSGELESITVGRRRLVAHDALERFLTTRAAVANSAA